MSFSKEVLKFDSQPEVERLCAFIQKQVEVMKKSGAVIGISGGVDSAVCSALCLRALGKGSVLGLILPEKESNPISAEYAERHAGQYGLRCVTEDITPTLTGFGAYERRDRVIREIFPEYTGGYKSQIVLPPDLLSKDAFNYFTLKIMDPKGAIKTARLSNTAMHSIVAASNAKQITRMMFLNYYAELNNYLVCGTTNRTEYVQGFFVKYGDGGVDVEPIAHLYKMQVYQLAHFLGISREIIDRAPSPDTFSLPVTDEEMYFRIPYHILDLLLAAWEKRVPIAEVCSALDLSEEQVKRAFRDLSAKYNATNYLRLPPATITA